MLKAFPWPINIKVRIKDQYYEKELDGGHYNGLGSDSTMLCILHKKCSHVNSYLLFKPTMDFEGPVLLFLFMFQLTLLLWILW